MSGMDYARMYAISLYTVLPNQLHGTEVDIDVLFTKAPLISFSLIDDTPLTRHYDLKYASLDENSDYIDLKMMEQELNQAIAEQTEAPVIVSTVEIDEPSPIVWETEFNYDDSVRDDPVTGLEVIITYPEDILYQRKNKRGYRFKLNNLDAGIVVEGELKENKMKTTTRTTNPSNDLSLEANINLAKHFTIYPETVVIEEDGNKDTNEN